MRNQLIEFLHHRAEYPQPKLRDGLGDFTKSYLNFHTETDIKTKIMILASAPKGYNIDKILEFLSGDNTVFMIYFVGIDYEKKECVPFVVEFGSSGNPGENQGLPIRLTLV